MEWIVLELVLIAYVKDYGASHIFQEIPEEASMERFVQWQADTDTPEKCDTTIVRLVSRSLDVWLTPLVPAVALQFLEENSRHVRILPLLRR